MLTTEQVAGLVRVCKRQVRLAVAPWDPVGLLAIRLDELPVRVSRRGRPGRAGRAGFFQPVGEAVGYVCVNVGVCYTEERFVAVLYHELAHAVNRWIHGTEVPPHGPTWRAVMERLGQEPKRCHDYADRV